jgi:Flp pilus assembly protein TadB
MSKRYSEDEYSLPDFTSKQKRIRKPNKRFFSLQFIFAVVLFAVTLFLLNTIFISFFQSFMQTGEFVVNLKHLDKSSIRTFQKAFPLYGYNSKIAQIRKTETNYIGSFLVINILF